MEGGSFKGLLNIDQYTVTPFSAFDYGNSKNLKRYGQKNPIIYNYSAIKIPIYLVFCAASTNIKKKVS